MKKNYKYHVDWHFGQTVAPDSKYPDLHTHLPELSDLCHKL